MTAHHLRRFVAALTLALALPMALAGCGDDKEPDMPAQLTSATDEAFQEVTYEGKRHVVGHGLDLTVPASWVTYGDEAPNLVGDTIDWAIGLPDGTKPFPAYVSISAGVKDAVTPYKDLPKGAKILAEMEPGYELVDEGKLTVKGGHDATFLRFKRNETVAGQTVPVEQVSLFVDVAKGVATTIRFISAAGDWENQFKSVYDSVGVAIGESKQA
jgi:hypothetical protein